MQQTSGSGMDGAKLEEFVFCVSVPIIANSDSALLFPISSLAPFSLDDDEIDTETMVRKMD
jgi:hypothetical protein